MKVRSLKKETRRDCRPALADLHHFDEVQDQHPCPDPDKIEQSDPDPLKMKKRDPDPHHRVSDSEHCPKDKNTPSLLILFFKKRYSYAANIQISTFRNADNFIYRACGLGKFRGFKSASRFVGFECRLWQRIRLESLVHCV
jgi:hypothetical protein